MVVVGGIIGSGIFINPHLVAQRLTSGTAVLAAWIVGGGIALAGAFAFAELATLFPRAGGEYVYLREAYHPLVAFLFGWASLLMIQGGGLAAVAIAFAEYALRLTGRSPSGATLLAVVSIAVVAGINVLGVKPGSRLLNVLVILKLAALAILIGGGLLLSRPAVAPPAAVSAGGVGLVAFGAALVPDPKRTLPIALMAGIAIVIAVYLLANIVYLLVLSRPGLAATATPAAEAVRQIFGAGSDRLISAAIAISAFGFLGLTLLAQTRIYYAMGKDGVFFPSLGTLHPRFQTPAVAILLQAAWGIVLVLTGTYGELVDSVVFGDAIFFALTVAGILIFRRRFPVEKRARGTFRSPLYPILPILFVAATVGIVASTIASNPRRSAFGAALLALGVPFYFWFTRRNRPRAPGFDRTDEP